MSLKKKTAITIICMSVVISAVLFVQKQTFFEMSEYIRLLILIVAFFGGGAVLSYVNKH